MIPLGMDTIVLRNSKVIPFHRILSDYFKILITSMFQSVRSTDNIIILNVILGDPQKFNITI